MSKSLLITASLCAHCITHAMSHSCSFLIVEVNCFVTVLYPDIIGDAENVTPWMRCYCNWTKILYEGSSAVSVISSTKCLNECSQLQWNMFQVTEPYRGEWYPSSVMTIIMTITTSGQASISRWSFLSNTSWSWEKAHSPRKTICRLNRFPDWWESTSKMSGTAAKLPSCESSKKFISTEAHKSSSFSWRLFITGMSAQLSLVRGASCAGLGTSTTRTLPK